MENLKKIVKIKTQISALKKELDSLSAPLIEEARTALTTQKHTVGSVSLQVVVKHRFKAIKNDVLIGLRNERKLFKRVTKVTVKDSDGLLAAAKAAGLDLAPYCAISEHYEPIKGAAGVGSPAVQEILRQHIYSPSVEIKKVL